MDSDRYLGLVAAVLLTCVMGCGDGGGSSSKGEPPLPSRDDPAFGTAGNALISDRLTSVDASIDLLWVGFSRKEQWDTLVALSQEQPALYVGGPLVVDGGHHLGFYFDPAATRGAHTVAEGLQTALDAIKADPARAQLDEPPSGWVVGVSVERLEPASE